jgi:hypothetical protein
MKEDKSKCYDTHNFSDIVVRQKNFGFGVDGRFNYFFFYFADGTDIILRLSSLERSCI